MNIGRFKTWYLRTASYFGMINFVMILYLVIVESPMLVVYIPLGVIALIVWMYFDIRYIMGQEIDYSWNKSPVIQELLADVKDIKRALEEK